MIEGIKVRRRFVLIGGAGAAASAGLAASGLPVRAQEGDSALPDYARWKEADAVIIHSEQTMETKRGAIGLGVVTPSDRLYVRNNLAPPSEDIVADRDAWEVSIEGVGDERTMTLGELKKLGVETVVTVLQCSGNGRGLYDHEASGSPWVTGAAGCVVWTGVPVRAIVEELGGVADGRNFMTGTGGEVIPEGLDVKDLIVERSVPTEALETAILAWEMNDEPLTLAHGGPLRLVIPGYYGVNNVKYVKRLAFTENETDANIQASGYRLRDVGVDGAPDQPSMWEMPVKSWVTHPLMDAESGRVMIHGVAFGGMSTVDKVEVSTDGGESWQEASFVGPDLGRYAWRPFVLSADLEPGTYMITSRATDSDGNVQEETSKPNHRGYDYRGWDRLAVEVTVA